MGRGTTGLGAGVGEAGSNGAIEIIGFGAFGLGVGDGFGIGGAALSLTS